MFQTLSYPPTQKTPGVSPGMNASDGPLRSSTREGFGPRGEERRGVSASADSAEEINDTTGVSPWSFIKSLLGARPLGLDLWADARRSEDVAAIARTSHRFGFAVGNEHALT
jgi:hypothetical protein